MTSGPNVCAPDAGTEEAPDTHDTGVLVSVMQSGKGRIREFELPYLTTHISFVFGLVSFMSTIGLRVWIQFGDSTPSPFESGDPATACTLRRAETAREFFARCTRQTWTQGWAAQ